MEALIEIHNRQVEQSQNASTHKRNNTQKTQPSIYERDVENPFGPSKELQRTFVNEEGAKGLAKTPSKPPLQQKYLSQLQPNDYSSELKPVKKLPLMSESPARF